MTGIHVQRQARLRLPRVRMVGIGLLCVCLFALYHLHELVTGLPRHQPSVAEMLLSLTAVLTGAGGALATSFGRALFQPCPPPRSEADR